MLGACSWCRSVTLVGYDGAALLACRVLSHQPPQTFNATVAKFLQQPIESTSVRPIARATPLPRYQNQTCDLRSAEACTKKEGCTPGTQGVSSSSSHLKPTISAHSAGQIMFSTEVRRICQQPRLDPLPQWRQGLSKGWAACGVPSPSVLIRCPPPPPLYPTPTKER